DIHVQRRAAVALCFINDQAATQDAVLTKVRELGPNAMVAEWLAHADAAPSVVLPMYLKAMRSREPTARLGGITGLRLELTAALVDKRFAAAVRSVVQHALADRDPRVRYEAIVAVQSHAEPQFVGILTEIAKNDP